MTLFRHRAPLMVAFIAVYLLVVGCAPAATPPPDPTPVLLAPEVVEPTSPPPTETAELPSPTAEPSPTEMPDVPTPTSEPDATELPDLAIDLEAGIAAYQSLGCIGCHTLAAADAVGAVGPSHDGIATTAQERIADPSYTGSATTAEAYIRESILDPTVFTVAGYPEGIMPSFTTMDEAQIDAIVTMLMEQR